ncbi:hypothetical protein ACWC9T_20970 [Kitasatospora sp. NPDC001159]
MPTSTGAVFGIDACLRLVYSHHANADADPVTLQYITPPWHEGGQAQTIEQ